MTGYRRGAPVVSDRWLVVLLVMLALAVGIAYVAFGVGREDGMRPGDTAGHLFGVAGALLLAVGLAFPLIKRTATLSGAKSWWHQGHLVLGATGAAMAALHVSGRMGKAPALVALAVLGLIVLGAYGRLLGSRLAYTHFAADPLAFLPADPGEAERFLPIVRQKRLLVAGIEPAAREGIFGLALRHWLRHPVLAARFLVLSLREESMVGDKRRGGGGLVWALQRNWRLLHLVLVGLMGAGLMAHVVMVLFFAGYLADGGEVYWWHLRQ